MANGKDGRRTVRRMQARLLFTTAAACWLAASAAHAACPGGTVAVERGDTISRIAKRCDVAERVLLGANPGIDGSDDLVVGRALQLDPDAQARRIADRLNGYAADANEAIGRVAGRVGSSVQDLLDRNPDLRSRVEGIGRKLGIADGDGSAPSATVTPTSAPVGAAVSVTAVNLPKSVPVSVTAGPVGSASEPIQNAQTSSNGTFAVTVAAPPWAGGERILFSIRQGDTLLARTGPLQVDP